MSSCEHYQELISRMVDGELDLREEADLKRHLETCPDCAELYRAFSVLSEEIRSDLEPVPLDLRDNVIAEIQREEMRRRKRMPLILRTAMSLAACAVLVVGLYFGLSMSKGSPISALVFRSKDAAAPQAAAGEELEAEAPAVAEEEKAIAAEEKVEVNTAEVPKAMPAPSLRADEASVEKDAGDAASFRDALSASEAVPSAEAAVSQADSAAEEPADAADAPEEAEAEALPEEEAPAAEPEALPAEESPAEETAPEPETRELSSWDISLFWELMDGKPSELTREELEPLCVCRILLRTEKESWEIPVYEQDGVLFYFDPVEERVFRAQLSPEQFWEFLG